MNASRLIGLSSTICATIPVRRMAGDKGGGVPVSVGHAPSAAARRAGSNHSDAPCWWTSKSRRLRSDVRDQGRAGHRTPLPGASGRRGGPVRWRALSFLRVTDAGRKNATASRSRPACYAELPVVASGWRLPQRGMTSRHQSRRSPAPKDRVTALVACVPASRPGSESESENRARVNL